MVDKTMVGRKNIYVCNTCRQHIVTVHVEHGCAPFSISCKKTDGCQGTMFSQFYPEIPEDVKAEFEWYKPTTFDHYPEEYRQAMREHVEAGGLDIRKCAKGGQ